MFFKRKKERLHKNENNELISLSLGHQYGCHEVVDTRNATVQVWRYSNLVPKVFSLVPEKGHERYWWKSGILRSGKYLTDRVDPIPSWPRNKTQFSKSFWCVLGEVDFSFLFYKFHSSSD